MTQSRQAGTHPIIRIVRCRMPAVYTADRFIPTVSTGSRSVDGMLGSMNGWHIAHLLSLGGWAGLVLTESVMELVSHRSERLRYAVARLHRAIDLWVELPLLALVLVTGVILLLSVQPDGALHMKVTCGLTAIAANVACVFYVLKRGRIAETGVDVRAHDRLTKRIFLTASVGMPLALVALYLGGARQGWW